MPKGASRASTFEPRQFQKASRAIRREKRTRAVSL